MSPNGWKNWNGEWVNPARYAALRAAAGLPPEDGAPAPEAPAPVATGAGGPVKARKSKAVKAKPADDAAPLGGGIVTAADDLAAAADADADASLAEAGLALSAAFDALAEEAP